MATLLQKMAKSAEAEPLYRQALNICSRAQVKDAQVGCVCVCGGASAQRMQQGAGQGHAGRMCVGRGADHGLADGGWGVNGTQVVGVGSRSRSCRLGEGRSRTPRCG